MEPEIEEAKKVFDKYAALDRGNLPSGGLVNMEALQVMLCRWQNANFGVSSIEELTLGVSEEAGELCHAVLKHKQKIRGLGDKDAFVDAAGDAIADCTIYLMQLSTLLRLDFWTLISETADKVMKRDWTQTEVIPNECVFCHKDTGGKHYDDVPDTGILCVKCHSEWVTT